MAASVLYDCGYSFLLSKGAQNDAENHWHEIPQYPNLLRKSMDWFLYDNGLRRERVKQADEKDYFDLAL